MSGLGRPLAAGTAGIAVLVLLVASVAGSALGGLLGGTGIAIAPSATAIGAIPASYLSLYQQAAATCEGLSWAVLAAIGTVESDSGHSNLPGVSAGENAAGAMGPMQMLEATFAAYDTPVPPGGANPPSPYDPTDAIYAAARMLCADGGRNGANLPQAVWDYNHSSTYVQEVLGLAARYDQSGTRPALAATTAVDWALAQVGTPYVWGGETPGVGFDCSGLVQAAYRVAGISLPRTSEAQWSALPHVPLDQLEPGDLVFFNPGEFIPGLPGHVGIYIGHNEMVDAPHTGATVQIENLSDWPTPMGAARPTAGQTGA